MNNFNIKNNYLPDLSMDDSPFQDYKTVKPNKKKSQTKLTFTRQTASKKLKDKSLKNMSTSSDVREVVENTCTSHVAKQQSTNSVISENVGDNLQENTILACPVCWKKLENCDKIPHMKTCAAKYNLTLKQLLDALDLQTKQVNERRNLGLPSVTSFTASKRVSSRKNSSAGGKIDPDLQLGLALSASMNETNDQNHLIEQEMLLEAGLGEEVAANQGALLEKFGFTSSKPVLPSMYGRSRAGKQKILSTPLLLLRTQDEREKIITEKVAIVLTGEEIECEPSLKHDFPVMDLKSEVLIQIQIKCSLWKKANLSPSSDESGGYYVEPLSHFISPSTSKVGSKLRHLSQLPCRIKSPDRNSISLSTLCEVNDNIDVNMIVRNESKFPNKTCDHSEEMLQEAVEGSISFKREVLKNSDSMNAFVRDWENLLNNPTRSDLKIYVKTDETIYAHELVFFVRCQSILRDVEEDNSAKKAVKYINWRELSFKGAFAFLHFIYCGSTSKIEELDDCINDVVYLSTKYCVEGLCHYAEGNTDNWQRTNCINELDASEVQSWNRSGVHDNDWSISGEQHANASVISRCAMEMKCIENESEVCCVRQDSSNKGDKIGLHESNVQCITLHSPDPFSDSESPERFSSYKSESFVTQQNLNELLEALSDNDEMGAAFCSNKYEIEKSKILNIVVKSSEEGVMSSGGCGINDAPTVEKRKLSEDTDTSEIKRKCTNNRKSSKKSLLDKFSGEGEKMLSVEEEIVKIDVSGSSDNDSIHVVAEHVKIPSSCSSVHGTVKDSIQQDMRDENVKIDNYSPLQEKNPNVIIAENSFERNDEQGDTDALADMCEDFEYQNFYANYSPPIFDQVNVNEESILNKNSPSKDIHDIINMKNDKSPFSSPLSVKSLTRGDSPLLSKKKKSKFLLSRTRSLSDNSVHSDASASSPVSIKCVSQNSIHLKSSLETLKRRNAFSPSSVYNEREGPVSPCHGFQTPKSSLSAVKRLLEDSFTAELEKNILARRFSEEISSCSTPIDSVVRTSIRNKLLESVVDEENCVTPLANYSGMDTPMLKRELHKYGLKSLKRKRAKQILKHIYNELHPVSLQPNCNLPCSADDMQGVEPLVSSENEKKTQNTKAGKKKRNAGKEGAASNVKQVNEPRSENEPSLSSTQESSSSSLCEFEDVQEEVAFTQTDISELPTIMKNYIKNNPIFHQQVLLYEPVWLESLQDALKAQNYKFKLNQLMEFLDGECITFRTAQGPRTKRRQKKKTSNKHKMDV